MSLSCSKKRIKATEQSYFKDSHALTSNRKREISPQTDFPSKIFFQTFPFHAFPAAIFIGNSFQFLPIICVKSSNKSVTVSSSGESSESGEKCINISLGATFKVVLQANRCEKKLSSELWKAKKVLSLQCFKRFKIFTRSTEKKNLCFLVRNNFLVHFYATYVIWVYLGASLLPFEFV